ncbi:hypothetical protein [Geobacillus sp. E263]|uniref:hypothetical protein n=1 Tax=Geobacillus sp. E263 TaxID=391290 RepID=UPI00117A2A3E|nr:hypothetical protein [Geobacillus sp. E263]
MELAVACQDIQQLSLIKGDKGLTALNSVERETYLYIQKCVRSRLGHFSPTRLYFGSEFCQYRIPKEADLKTAYAFAKENGYDFTFVTPYVPEAGMRKLLPLLEWLETEGSGVEVVVSDWGVLYMIVTTFPSLQPVVGRLLNKMIRDPRVAHRYDQTEAPKQAKEVFFHSSFETASFQTFFRRFHVKSVEYDSFIQTVHALKTPLSISLHLGFAVIATGRSCLVGTLHQPKEKKFKGDVSCKQQCRHYAAELINKKPQLGELPVRIFQKGNTAFYKQTFELVEKGLDWAFENGVRRLVVHPKIPV